MIDLGQPVYEELNKQFQTVISAHNFTPTWHHLQLIKPLRDQIDEKLEDSLFVKFDRRLDFQLNDLLRWQLRSELNPNSLLNSFIIALLRNFS